jgi:phosphonopyruvate decarboxylase
VIRPSQIVHDLEAVGVRYVFGVPDSLLAPLVREVTRRWDPERHVVAANEGAAVALAIGTFLGTRTLPVVYLQNSGIGNAANPLVSLAAPDVLGIPILLLVGWRGELDAAGQPVDDEPQHRLQGRITLPLLDCLDVPTLVVDQTTGASDAVRSIADVALVRNGPAALVFRRSSFEGTTSDAPARTGAPDRETIVATVVATLPEDVPVVATTGYIGRELLRARLRAGGDGRQDLLAVGGMGHAVSIAAGLALSRPDRKVVCLDGDGSVAMHTGALLTASRCGNLVHVVINNRVHESVGGQPSAAEDALLTAVASACGYSYTERVGSVDELQQAMRRSLDRPGSAFVEAMSSPSDDTPPPRPTTTPREQRDAFLSRLHG